VTSPPIRLLAEASGWIWPDDPDTLALLEALAGLSASWDFRGRKERDSIAEAPAAVNGRLLPNDLVIPAARALGLVDSLPLPRSSFSHFAVLGGLVNACVNRAQRAAVMLRNGIEAPSVTVLGGHRELSETERARAGELGMGDLTDEAAVLVAAGRAAFSLEDGVTAADLDRPEPGWSGDPRGPVPEAAQTLYASSAHYSWPSADIVIAPSGEPAQRRANTADGLRHWATLEGIGAGDHVLLLTTQIYVPYQHLAAVSVLGLERGCAVYCCGVDAATSVLGLRAFGGRDYLQEIRSTLRAAVTLLKSAQEAQTSRRRDQ
jgi:hypothetical protein